MENYKIAQSSFSKFERDLNEHGKEGWILLSVIDTWKTAAVDTIYTYVLRRKSLAEINQPQ